MISKKFAQVLLLSGATYWGAIVNTASAEEIFVEATANLGSPQLCSSEEDPFAEGCYSHFVLSADFTGDGHLDIVFASGGGYYQPAEAQPMAFYKGTGDGTFTEMNATALGGFTGRVRQVAAGDIDNDGDLDLIAPDGYGMQGDAVFINNGSGTFTNEGVARLGKQSRAGATKLGDVDGDLDLDLVITDWGAAPPSSAGTAKVYLNDGTGHFTEKANAVPQNTEGTGTGPIDVELFDADNDFDLDMLLASREGDSLLFLNDGTGTYVDANDKLPPQQGPYVYGPDVCDVNKDANLDVWLDNGGELLFEQLMLGDGTGTFTDATSRITGNQQADDNEVQCVDIDNDGDMDALIASLGLTERLFINDGNGNFAARATEAFPAISGSDATLGLDLGDFNEDGRIDAVTAQGEFGAFLNRLYLATSAAPVDTTAPIFRTKRLERGAPLDSTKPSRFTVAISDAFTTDIGPRLQSVTLRIANGAALPLRYRGGDLFEIVIKPDELPLAARGTICAVDLKNNSTCTEDFQVYDAEPLPPLPEDKDDGCGCRGGNSNWNLLLSLSVLATLLQRKRHN